jgi:hypothetical protein
MPFRLVGKLHDRALCLVLRPGRNLLGSAGDCALRVEHPTVSRHHAELIVEGETVEVKDLGSRNGTFLKDRRVPSGQPAVGEAIGFGRVQLVLERVEKTAGERATRSDVGRALEGESHTAELKAAAVGLEDVSHFALEHLPVLVRGLADGAGLPQMAKAGGAALFHTLPVLEVEVLTRDASGAHVLFEARRGGGALVEGVEVRAAERALQLRAVFLTVGGARHFRPLVEAVAALIGLARDRPAAAPRRDA